MTTAYLRLSLLASLLALAGCASKPAPSQLRELHREVGKLSQQMRQLTDQATALEQQGQLNGGSAQGAWLLPAAATGVILKSQAGELQLSLGQVEAAASGSRAVLHIHSKGNAPLPAFTASVEWGELDATTGKPLTVDSQTQQIAVHAALLPRSEASIPLPLNNLTPQQLGYVRVHQVLLTDSAPGGNAP
ncbi:DUF3251 domain-containing protein [Erwinia sp. E602]|uniref:DUF3251 domain-containing protein n=1 Tax=unclassified Erwinia TaxID=2622719 RepID=UPI0006F61116|nr:MULTISPECIES: DUF3251 domain-containing protein [unclassified Erwinia]KQN63109.1 hypothetical protein ASF13_20855 [Erwinia sp. Leaf53]PLV61181.1 hypothetical protein NV64_09930 [Erwinia sp. B116]QUG76897.1 DUF3251 domain-containing protein [Erwinia sp. E602]